MISLYIRTPTLLLNRASFTQFDPTSEVDTTRPPVLIRQILAINLSFPLPKRDTYYTIHAYHLSQSQYMHVSLYSGYL
jgi:hypothetical protein